MLSRIQSGNHYLTVGGTARAVVAFLSRGHYVSNGVI